MVEPKLQVSELARDRIDALYCQAQARWPKVVLSSDEFSCYLCDRYRETGDGAVCDHATDLYLACACVRGIPAAIRALEQEYLASVVSSTATRTGRDDLHQTVLERLLAYSKDGGCKLAEYSGRSSLRAWLRVVVRRAELNLVRGLANQPTRNLDELSESQLLPAGSDPELDYLRYHYAQEFRNAFRAALSSLDARDVLMLRMRLVNQTTGSEMAGLFGVSRVTIVRWMANIRERILATTREHLERDLRLSHAEFESVVRLVWKQLSVSLSILAEERPQ